MKLVEKLVKELVEKPEGTLLAGGTTDVVLELEVEIDGTVESEEFAEEEEGTHRYPNPEHNPSSKNGSPPKNVQSAEERPSEHHGLYGRQQEYRGVLLELEEKTLDEELGKLPSEEEVEKKMI